MMSRMMKSTVIVLLALLAVCCSAYIPKSAKTVNKSPLAELNKAATGAFAAFTIASSVILTPAPPAANAALTTSFVPSSSQVLAEKIVREGLYKDYEIDVPDQVFDDAKSTFKSASETKSKKGKYTAILAVLIVGSFVIPMAQYFWYVRDDDSSDKFFAEEVPEPPKKKGWF